MKSLQGLFLMVVLLALPVSYSLSQDLPKPGQMGLDVSNVIQANNKALAGYTWKNTLEINKDGETVSTTVKQIKIADGKPEATLISQEPQEEHKKGLRGRKQDKEKKYLASAVELAAGYAMPASGSLVNFFEKATFALGTGSMEGYVQVQGSGLVNEADKVTMWVGSSTFQPHKTEYSTKLDGETMEGSVTYAAMSEAELFYVASSVLTIASKSLVITSKNSDHEAVE